MAHSNTPRQAYFAYWFRGGGHETPSYLKRTFFGAWDDLVRGVRHRWAYIAVSTDRPEGAADPTGPLCAFLRDFYPLIVREPGR